MIARGSSTVDLLLLLCTPRLSAWLRFVGRLTTFTGRPLINLFRLVDEGGGNRVVVAS